MRNNEDDFKDERLVEFFKILQHGYTISSLDDGLITNTNLNQQNFTKDNTNTSESTNDQQHSLTMNTEKNLFYDIIALQEMFGSMSRRRQKLFAFATQVGYQFVVFLLIYDFLLHFVFFLFSLFFVCCFLFGKVSITDCVFVFLMKISRLFSTSFVDDRRRISDFESLSHRRIQMGTLRTR